MPGSSTLLLHLQGAGAAPFCGLAFFFKALARVFCRCGALRNLPCYFCAMPLLLLLQALCTLLRLKGALLLKHVGRNLGAARAGKNYRLCRRLSAPGNVVQTQGGTFTAFGIVQNGLPLRQQCRGFACAAALTVKTGLRCKALVARCLPLLQCFVDGLPLLLTLGTLP